MEQIENTPGQNTKEENSPVPNMEVDPRNKEMKDIKPLAKGDKVYQSVRADILQKEKLKSKAATRGSKEKRPRDVKNRNPSD